MRHWTPDDALYWWRLGKDTQQIAEILNRGQFKSRRRALSRGMEMIKPATEAEVYIALHVAREKARRSRAA